MIRRSISIFTILLFCLMMAASVHAQSTVPNKIPNYLNYQGKLEEKDPYRGPIPANGTYTITFRIYGDSDDPIKDCLWEETREVEVVIGIFNLTLGEIETLDLEFEQDYWLGLDVDPNGEMTPRQRILSTGYSFMPQDSYSLDDIHASTTPQANKLLALDASGKFPNSILKMGDGRGLDADTVDGIHYFAIASQISELDEKIETHETNDEVMNGEGDYPNMHVGYARSAGSASSASYASSAGSVAWGNITDRPSELDPFNKHCRGGNCANPGSYGITSGTCDGFCQARHLYCEWAKEPIIAGMFGCKDPSCSYNASLAHDGVLSCRYCDHNW